ncbi:MAG TPA: DNA-processing protein DprA [Planctomycetota bacterium]|nr:DNA-processing protein DprA [Planctomycetota bacterium]
MESDLESLVALNLTGLVGAALHRRLCERFGSARAALRANRADLRRVHGIGEITSEAIVEAARSGEAAREIELAASEGVSILPFGGPGYPAALGNLYDPPLVLYVRGALEERDLLGVGVVGSREATPYGLRQAGRFGMELAALGVTVVSGLARGIDTQAHHGALRAKEGRTLAVLGSGVGAVYPPENLALSLRIAERGALLSEFPVRSTPAPENFPRRNRLISGLSLGILVVEAGEKSGALITADWAMEQGREVFALPGSVESPMSRGTHLLIRQGAKLAECAADVLEELPAIAPLLKSPVAAAAVSPIERAVLRELGTKSRTSESLAASSKLPECSVIASLERLAARGLVTSDGPLYRAAPGAISG